MAVLNLCANVGALGGGVHRPRQGGKHSAVRVEPAACAVLVRVRVPRLVPEWVLNGTSVYEARAAHGRAPRRHHRQVHAGGSDRRRHCRSPQSPRPAAMQVARKLGIEYREGLLQGAAPTSGRTSPPPGQAVRKKSVRQKLNANRRARGREKKCNSSTALSSAARHPRRSSRWRGMPGRSRSNSPRPPCLCVTPTSTASTCPCAHQLVAHGRTIPEIAKGLPPGAECKVYQEIDDLKAAILESSPGPW